MITSTSRLLSALALTCASSAAFAIGPYTPPATAITSSYTTFANLPGATFGGTGIPTDPTAITTFGNVTLGLSATARGANGTPLTNNSAGTFFATPNTTAGTASWNFDFYVSTTSAGGLSSDGYTYKLLYDFNSGVGTPQSQFGIYSIPLTGSTFQDSENLGFGYLSSPVYVTPPAGAFNSLASGEYSFALVALNSSNVEVARSAINVDVGTVPEPAPLALMGLALVGLFGARKLRRNKQA